MKKEIINDIIEFETPTEIEGSTWEQRIDNCIAARENAECPEFKNLWNQILLQVLAKAKKQILFN